jgi:hypothetical protein
MRHVASLHKWQRAFQIGDLTITNGLALTKIYLCGEEYK